MQQELFSSVFLFEILRHFRLICTHDFIIYVCNQEKEKQRDRERRRKKREFVIIWMMKDNGKCYHNNNNDMNVIVFHLTSGKHFYSIYTLYLLFIFSILLCLCAAVLAMQSYEYIF